MDAFIILSISAFSLGLNFLISNFFVKRDFIQVTFQDKYIVATLMNVLLVPLHLILIHKLNINLTILVFLLLMVLPFIVSLYLMFKRVDSLRNARHLEELKIFRNSLTLFEAYANIASGILPWFLVNKYIANKYASQKHLVEEDSWGECPSCFNKTWSSERVILTNELPNLIYDNENENWKITCKKCGYSRVETINDSFLNKPLIDPD
ncbi:MAG: hypothetical protein AB7I27_00095 [Bacteriovoracaceae bacterium]